jgi:hypothetical protein
MSKNESSPTNNKDISSLYDDERTQIRIHEHLNNEDDIITEQDIANISIGIVGDEEIRRLAEIQEKNDRPVDYNSGEIEDKKILDNEDPEIETTWNILGA